MSSVQTLKFHIISASPCQYVSVHCQSPPPKNIFILLESHLRQKAFHVGYSKKVRLLLPHPHPFTVLHIAQSLCTKCIRLSNHGSQWGPCLFSYSFCLHFFLFFIHSKTLPKSEGLISACWHNSFTIWGHSHMKYPGCVT